MLNGNNVITDKYLSISTWKPWKKPKRKSQNRVLTVKQAAKVKTAKKTVKREQHNGDARTLVSNAPTLRGQPIIVRLRGGQVIKVLRLLSDFIIPKLIGTI